MTTRVFRRVLPWLLMLVTVLALAGDEKLRLAVMGVHDQSGLFKPKALEAATDLLRTLLTKSEKFIIIDKGQQEKELRKMYAEQKKETYKECYDKSCQIELGQALAANTLLRSQISKLGKLCALSSEMIDLGKEVGVKSGIGKFNCTEDGLFGAIEEVAAQLTGVSAGCAKDADCKGERVCEKGKCVEPPQPPNGGLSASGQTWTDARSGLMWQAVPPSKTMNWESAKSYCADLTLDKYSDWRLPSIGELRSLIRGCPTTQIEGSCPVTDECLTGSCLNDSCGGCSEKEGPGAGGHYWPSELPKVDQWWFWSSSSRGQSPDYVWYVGFGEGDVRSHPKGQLSNDVRCVRGGT